MHGSAIQGGLKLLVCVLRFNSCLQQSTILKFSKHDHRPYLDEKNWSCKTRSTGTVHTSAKARLTSVAIPIRIRIRDLDRHQKLIICLLAHCQPSLKISCKSVRKFLRKVANRQRDRQTNRQTTTNDYISSFAVVISEHLAVDSLMLRVAASLPVSLLICRKTFSVKK